MAKVIVVIETSHDDDDAAVRSVKGGLKRAGYDILEYMVPGETTPLHAVVETIYEMVKNSDPLCIQAAEPDVDERV